MNIKVVIVWIGAILLFLGIGLFGFLNRDLLETPTIIKDDTNNQVDYDAKTCVASVDNGDVTYTFRINKDTNLIERLVVKYEAKVENIDIYSTVSNINANINNKIVNGISSNLYGTSSDAVLNISANIYSFDQTTINEMSSELLKVGMVISKTTNYNDYVSLINNSNHTTFTCN